MGPIPVTVGKITVNATAPIVSLEVISVVGETVIPRHFSGRQTEIKLALSGLTSGIYFMRATFEDNQAVTRKIIVQ